MGHLENVALKLFSFLRTNFRKYKRREAVGQLVLAACIGGELSLHNLCHEKGVSSPKTVLLLLYHRTYVRYDTWSLYHP
jgi:hypothetical protein